MQQNLPLQGIRVVDLSRILSGPYCAMLLADMGAQVLKVESPQSPDQARTCLWQLVRHLRVLLLGRHPAAARDRDELPALAVERRHLRVSVAVCDWVSGRRCCLHRGVEDR
nr:CoA transferase [Acidovorax sp.]